MDERLSWPGWLTYSGWLTHISGYPSATGRAQDSKSSIAKDRHSTAVPHSQCSVLNKWTLSTAGIYCTDVLSKAAGTDEECLIEMLSTHSNQETEDIKWAYEVS